MYGNDLKVSKTPRWKKEFFKNSQLKKSYGQKSVKISYIEFLKENFLSERSDIARTLKVPRLEPLHDQN